MTINSAPDQSSNSGATASTDGLTAPGNHQLAQLYRAGATGTLLAVRISVNYRGGPRTLRPRVSIHSVVDGKPASAALGDVTLSTKNIAWSEPVMFSSGVAQTAGDDYAIVVTYSAGQSGDSVRWTGIVSESETERRSLISNGGDWAAQPITCDFQTFVEVMAAGAMPSFGAMASDPQSMARAPVQGTPAPDDSGNE